MSIDTPADTIVDSVRIDYYGVDIFITPDGKRLLAMRYDYDNGHKMEVFNTSDLSHIGTLEQYGCYHFDGADNYGILNNFTKIYFINPSDLIPLDSVDFNLPPEENLRDGYLDTISNQYFVTTSILADTTCIIYQIDCNSRTVIDSIKSSRYWGSIGPLAYNWLTNDLYFMTIFYDGAYFRQYDLAGDSLINSMSISHITGSISVSFDGKKVYMTDGGDGFHGLLPLHPIWVFDAFTHQPAYWITPWDTSGRWVGDLFGQIILTPDNRRAYLAGNPNSAGGTAVTVMDLRQNRILKVIEPFDVPDAFRIALGPVPD